MLSGVFTLTIFLIVFIPTLFLFVRQNFLPALQPSVEPTVWAQVRFIVDNFPNLSWFSTWYLGFPFRFSGPPVFTYLLAVLSKITNIPIPTLDGVILALSLAVLSVGVYFLANFLTRDKFASFLATLLFLVLPSAGYIFSQAAIIGADLNFLPFRIAGFLTFGGGQTLAGFAILPFLILAFWQAITNFSRKNFVLTTVLATILLLSDFSIFVSFVIFAIAVIATEGLKSSWLEKAKRGMLILITAAGLSAFWYTPSYLTNILASPSLSGLSLGQIFQRLFQFAAVAIPVFLAVFSFWSKKLKKQEIFVILSLGFFVFLTLLWWATDTDFLTLYSRFFTEIDIVIVLGIATLIKNSKLKIQNYSSKFKIFAFCIVTFIFAFLILHLSWRVASFPKISYEPKLEKEIATWLENHVSPTDRVYLSGSTAFWLNWFAPEVVQVRGGVDSAATHPFAAHASFNLREGESLQTALAWLKALRANYVVVHLPQSSEYYHDFKNPEKFQNIGEVVFNNRGGDIIYKVETPALAQIVGKNILSLEKPENGADFVNLAKYVEILEQGRKIRAEWLGPNKILVRASEIGENEGISVGVTYDPGWSGKLQTPNSKLQIKRDPIGNLFVNVQGRALRMSGVEIELEHGARRDRWIGYLVSVATLLLVVKPIWAKKLYTKLPRLHLGLEEE